MKNINTETDSSGLKLLAEEGKIYAMTSSNIDGYLIAQCVKIKKEIFSAKCFKYESDRDNNINFVINHKLVQFDVKDIVSEICSVEVINNQGCKQTAISMVEMNSILLSIAEMDGLI